MDYKVEMKKILKKLPHKLQVKFALDCAKECKHLLNDPDALKALEITELWLQGKATKEEVKKATYYTTVYYSASAAAYYAIYAAFYAACADAAFYTCYAAIYAASADAASAAINAANALNLPLKHYYTKLLDSLTDLEKEVYGITSADVEYESGKASNTLKAFFVKLGKTLRLY